jgi:hypothetical protein
MIHISVISLFVNTELEMKFRKFKLLIFINIGKITSDIRVPLITQCVKQKHVVTGISSITKFSFITAASYTAHMIQWLPLAITKCSKYKNSPEFSVVL